ncbi:formate dehydrogenase subunit gamma [Sagittula sp. SSi028]|uniref:formate dehydrogenase subunit gamma n=1 Tax=Sagittula sp. SSi028 TaxID=3400636 RepID=UPI003AF54D10
MTDRSKGRSRGVWGLLLIMAVLAGLSFMLAPPSAPPQDALDLAAAREATGGAQTLEDILRRQEGQKIDDSFRSSNTGGDAVPPREMSPLGNASDSDLWRAIRYDKLPDARVSTNTEVGQVMIQDGGMPWLTFRAGPLRTYGGWLLLGTIGLLAVFFVLRGRVMIEGGKTGHTVERFKLLERVVHWMTASSFVLLGFTGLFTLFGRKFLIPLMGHEANSWLLTGSKYIHNNVSWAFMLGIVLMFVMWVWHNIPNKLDLIWFKQYGGIVGDNHPPAEKFNAGQKIIFWSVVLFGTSVSVSGLSLLFPMELPLFAKSFLLANDLGVPSLLGMDPLPVNLAPQEEMQLAQLWHAIIAFVMMAIIIAHIYIGSVGMEGAFDAMGSGQVDENWAVQHHSIWYEKKVAAGEASAPPEALKSHTPAE